MTYDLGVGIYAPAWVALTGTFFLMAKWLREKMGLMCSRFVERIDGKNADLGLRRSVEPTDIARDYLLPMGNGAVSTYTDSEDYPREKYIAELDQDVGRPLGLIAFIALFALALLVVLLGPIMFLATGISHAPEYFLTLILLMTANLIAYLIF